MAPETGPVTETANWSETWMTSGGVIGTEFNHSIYLVTMLCFNPHPCGGCKCCAMYPLFLVTFDVSFPIRGDDEGHKVGIETGESFYITDALSTTNGQIIGDVADYFGRRSDGVIRCADDLPLADYMVDNGVIYLQGDVGFYLDCVLFFGIVISLSLCC